MEWTQEKLNELYLKIQRKAMTDEEYRKELLEDADAVIEREMGEKLPEGMKFQVVESDPKYSVTFVLPDMLSEELDDEDLDRVAGGICLIENLPQDGTCIKGYCGAEFSGPGQK